MTEHIETSPVLRRADLLLLLPFVWQLGFADWANGVEWSPFGIPFVMAWQMAGIVFATLVLALRYWLERKHRSGSVSAGAVSPDEGSCP
ncbi:DUF3311 domain-containing protein [Aurantiacibacter suaedae]|uniref:DUF3311 domain-containing protein n=1 Tax=Aurantiacibacter suaedae TaxID=2545755 RepID=UPI001386ACB3|nr:DUF3311 domain-containing protein [Aurantiacibacter suaedae]